MTGAGQVSLRGMRQPSWVETNWNQLGLVPPRHAHVTVAVVEWGQQPFVPQGRGAPAASHVGASEGADRGEMGENIKTYPGGPKDQGGRKLYHEHRVPPHESLGAVVTLIQSPFSLVKVGTAACKIQTITGRVSKSGVKGCTPGDLSATVMVFMISETIIIT